jgi:hypothetical protein
MKTKLIFASLIALATIGNSQVYLPNTGGVSPNGNVGIEGAWNPLYPLDILTGQTGGSGIRIKNTNQPLNMNGLGGEATLRLDAVTPGGEEYGIHSVGDGWGTAAPPRSLLIREESASGGPANRFLIEGGTGNVGIGTNAPGAHFHVVENSGISNAWGILGQSYGSGAEVCGVRGEGAGNGSVRAFGGAFISGGGSSYNIGVYGNCLDDNATLNAGVFGDALGLQNAWAGYFEGRVFASGGYYQGSDRNLKKDIRPIANSLSIIEKLNPVNYSFDVAANKYLGLPDEKQYGFISQEIREIMPELTKLVRHPAKLDNAGKELMPAKEILTLNYNGFIAILAKGIQEQQVMINELKSANDLQQQQIDELMRKASTATGIGEPNSGNGEAIMAQNEPNPFTHETVVKYTLPQSVSSAFMAVYDLTGKQITTFPINEKGSSSLTITSEKLAAGIYIYSIVADGKLVDSKRMIVSEK